MALSVWNAWDIGNGSVTRTTSVLFVPTFVSWFLHRGFRQSQDIECRGSGNWTRGAQHASTAVIFCSNHLSPHWDSKGQLPAFSSYAGFMTFYDKLAPSQVKQYTLVVEDATELTSDDSGNSVLDTVGTLRPWWSKIWQWQDWNWGMSPHVRTFFTWANLQQTCQYVSLFRVYPLRTRKTDPSRKCRIAQGIGKQQHPRMSKRPATQ